MPDPLRIVIDTNVYISFLLKRDSIPGQVVERCLRNHRILISPDLQKELYRKLLLSKFDRYVSLETRLDFFQTLVQITSDHTPTIQLAASRDEDDNRLLELAVDTKADLIISGDQDLRVLQPLPGGNLYSLRVKHSIESVNSRRIEIVSSLYSNSPARISCSNCLFFSLNTMFSCCNLGPLIFYLREGFSFLRNLNFGHRPVNRHTLFIRFIVIRFQGRI